MFGNDDLLCGQLTAVFKLAFPHLTIIGGAEEPFYKAGIAGKQSTLYYRSNYPRSLLHEMSHYCLAGKNRRQIDDFGYWYSPCGRTSEQQIKFEQVEARPQALEKIMCETIGISFSPSLDDFSGRPPSTDFLKSLNYNYNNLLENTPPTAKKALDALVKYYKNPEKFT